MSTPLSEKTLATIRPCHPARLTRRRLKRGAFRSIVELQAAINRYLAEHNQAPRPFTRTKTADQILDELNHPNASVH